MRKNQGLTRVTCSGIVDADDRQADEIAQLASLGIAVLPVSEIENVILLPPVSRALAMSNGYRDDALETKLNELKVRCFCNSEFSRSDRRCGNTVLPSADRPIPKTNRP